MQAQLPRAFKFCEFALNSSKLASLSRTQRSPEAQAYRRLYATQAWAAARQAQLSKQPLCERHLRRGEYVPASVVNHRIPHKGDWSLFIDPENHESSCKSCHDGAIQSEERRGFSTDIGLDGWPLDQRHPVNRSVRER